MAIINIHIKSLLDEFAKCSVKLLPINALFVAEVYRCILSNNLNEAYFRMLHDLQFRLDKTCYSTILAKINTEMFRQLDLDSSEPLESKQLDTAEQYEVFRKFIDSKLFAIKGDKTACIEIPGVKYSNLYTPCDTSNVAYFASSDLYPPKHENTNHINYECTRINALLERRKDMLNAQAKLNKFNTIEAYYPENSWITSSGVLSVPLNPPLVVHASDTTKNLFDNEMKELDIASKKITNMIKAYKQ